MWLFVRVCARVSRSLRPPPPPPKRASRGDKLERADSQTDGARGHPMRSCLPRLPFPSAPSLPPSHPPSSIPTRTLTDCVSRGVERAGPHQKSAFFSKIEKGSGRAVALGARKHPVSPRLSDAETPGKEKLKKKKKKKFDRARGHRLAVNTLIPPEHLQTAQWLLLSSAVGHIKIGRAYLHAEDTRE